MTTMRLHRGEVLFSVLFFMAFASFFIPKELAAATLYMDPPSSEIYRGDSIIVSVRLDVDEAERECINTVDAVIEYEAGIEPVDVSIGDSILRVWVEQPTIDRESRTISLAGGIPNGYCGRVQGDPRLTNKIVEIVFRSPGFTIGGSDDGEATLSFADTTTLYLNDGQGTKAKTQVYPASIILHDNTAQELTNDWKRRVDADKIDPEEFSITLHRDEVAFNGRYFIIFGTVDKQTGIDRYQVMEEPDGIPNPFAWGRADAPWVDASSPYVLKDQSLNSIIRVRALDKAGNEYVAVLNPEDALRTMSAGEMYRYVLIVGSIIAVLLFGSLAYFAFRRYWRREATKKNTDNDSDDNDNDEHFV